MSLINSSIQSVESVIGLAQSIIILLPSNPSSDHLRAGIALCLALQAAGKQVQLGAASLTSDTEVPGINHVKSSIGSRNLLVSFDYQEEYLEKVDYDVTAEGKFTLLIKPKADAPVPDISQVKFAYSGAESDLAILIGVSQKEDLGKIYADEKKYLDSVKLLSITNQLKPLSYESDKLAFDTTSLTELVSIYLTQTKSKLEPEIASSLIAGIYQSSQNLTSGKLTADTFSAISYLMSLGGQLANQSTFIGKLATPAFFDSPPLVDNNPPSDWKSPKIFRATPNIQ